MIILLDLQANLTYFKLTNVGGKVKKWKLNEKKKMKYKNIIWVKRFITVTKEDVILDAILTYWSLGQMTD